MGRGVRRRLCDSSFPPGEEALHARVGSGSERWQAQEGDHFLEPCEADESFLRAKKTQQAYRDARVNLWQMPPRSPDLNPVERFWSRLRHKLRAMDLKDAVAERPVLGKMAYKSRVRSVCSSQQAQRVAMACARGLKKVCKEVVRNKGAATSG